MNDSIFCWVYYLRLCICSFFTICVFKLRAFDNSIVVSIDGDCREEVSQKWRRACVKTTKVFDLTAKYDTVEELPSDLTETNQRNFKIFSTVVRSVHQSSYYSCSIIVMLYNVSQSMAFRNVCKSNVFSVGCPNFSIDYY